MKIRIMCAVFVLFFLSVTYAQEIEMHSKGLTVGDKVPNLFISKIINYKKSNAELSDFKSQLLILDFWSTNCSGCVAALPKMEVLQKQFGGKLSILPVTYEKQSLVTAFLKNNTNTRNLTLPSVVEDTVLSSNFRHVGVPHEVWIYKGRVVGITGSDYVDANNIQLVLDGKQNDWVIKDDFLPPFDFTKPLLKPELYCKGQFKYAAIFGFYHGATTNWGSAKDSVNNTIRNYITNSSILTAYLMTWHKIDTSFEPRPFPSHIKLEVKKPGKYEFYANNGYRANWLRSYAISYESIVPDTGQTEKRQHESVIQDLDYLLNIKGRWEVRKTKCLILVKSGGEEKFKSSGGKKSYGGFGPVRKLRNVPVESITDLINSEPKNPPCFNGTEYKGNIDIVIDETDLNNLTRIRHVLNSYGLDLKEEFRDVKLFIITENRKK